jgi:hypothetical protein
MYGKLITTLGARAMTRSEYVDTLSLVHTRIQRVTNADKDTMFRILNRPERASTDSIRILSNPLSPGNITALLKGFTVNSNTPAHHFDANSNTYSIKFNNFQIDFEMVSPTDFWTAYFYRNFENIGVLLNRIVRPLGLKLNDSGVILEVPAELAGHEESVTLAVTSEPPTICRAIGIPVTTFQYETSVLRDILNVIVSSPYCTKETFSNWTEEEIEKAPNLYAGVREFVDAPEGGVCRYDLVASTGMQLGEGASLKMMLRYVLRFFGIEDRYRVKVANLRATRNQRLLSAEGGLRAVLGEELTPRQVMDFTNYYKGRRRTYKKWMSEQSLETVKADMIEKYSEYKAAIQAIAAGVSVKSMTPQEVKSDEERAVLAKVKHDAEGYSF